MVESRLKLQPTKTGNPPESEKPRKKLVEKPGLSDSRRCPYSIRPKAMGPTFPTRRGTEPFALGSEVPTIGDGQSLLFHDLPGLPSPNSPAHVL